MQGSETQAGNALKTTIVQTLGGRLDGPSTNNHTRAGTAVITPISCDQLRLDFTFDGSDAAGDFRDLTGTIALERLGSCADDSDP